MSRFPRPRRSAFTLIELIVVLLIILILVGLLSSAAFKAMEKISVVGTSTDIAQMSLALQHFQTDFGLSDPPPSRLVLMEIFPYGGDPATINFLAKAFGKNLGQSLVAGGLPQLMNWAGLPGGPTGTGVYILEGEQCLVFYLGGIPQLQPNGLYQPLGFSANNINPTDIASPKRRGPYFTFQSPRLVPIQIVNPLATLLSPLHPAYIDYYQTKTLPALLHPAPYANGMPYAYFSSGGINSTTAAGVAGYFAATTNCSALNAVPYWMVSTTQYMNPTGCQILSAGKDGVFGTSGFLVNGGLLGPGADDQANFSAGLLVAGQQ